MDKASTFDHFHVHNLQSAPRGEKENLEAQNKLIFL